MLFAPWAFAGIAAAATVAPALPALPALFHATSSTSTNWGGYAATSARNTVTSVVGSWVVPAIQGTCPSTAQYSSFWVGIDGYNSNSVEQTGTDSDCQSGHAVYYAWYEFYPQPSHLISSLTISPGDTISASVKFASGNFTVKITDVTTGHSFSKKVLAKHQARSSAEWIAEAPSSITGILPLANFGTVGFGFDNTSVSGTNAATISGTTTLLGSLSNLVAITMVSQTSATTVKASPSAVSSDNTSFTVTWKSKGP
jgi:hypothetical protein